MQDVNCEGLDALVEHGPTVYPASRLRHISGDRVFQNRYPL